MQVNLFFPSHIILNEWWVGFVLTFLDSFNQLLHVSLFAHLIYDDVACLINHVLWFEQILVNLLKIIMGSNGPPANFDVHVISFLLDGVLLVFTPKVH